VCAEVRAGSITYTQSLPLTPTDFGPSTTNVSTIDPLTFQKFDTHGGALALDSVTVKLSAALQNNFGMTFTTPSTITDTVANSASLAAKAGGLTAPGPEITIFQPNGKTPLLTVAEPNDPNVLTRSVTYGSGKNQTLPQSFSSTLPSTSPYYIAPTHTQQSSNSTLTSPASLALFTGTGKISLPVSAAATSTMSISSGNGTGWVTTQGSATATITYNYHSTIPAGQTVPEPATVLLWSIGGVVALGLTRYRRRGA
jgi:hypothetical protein